MKQSINKTAGSPVPYGDPEVVSTDENKKVFYPSIRKRLSVIEECYVCHGMGFVRNPDFEICCKDPDHPSHDIDCTGLNYCTDAINCSLGEMIPCPNCNAGFY